MTSPRIDEFVELCQHTKSGRYFIVIDEQGERYRVINLQGDRASLPKNMFNDDPVLYDPEQANQLLTPEQIASYVQYAQELEEKLNQEERARKQVAAVSYAEPKTSSSTKRKQRGVSRQQSSRIDKKTGIASEWASSQLVFYRPQIEQLGLRQSFKVKVSGVGDFVISKQDFYSVFNDVLLSESYKKEGFFAYREIPDKAHRFLVVEACDS